MAYSEISGVRCKVPSLRGRSCGANSPVLRTKARKYLRQRKPIITLDAEQSEEVLKGWKPDVSTARKFFPD